MAAGADMHRQFCAPVPDVNLACQHVIDFQRGMLVKRIGHMRSQQEQPHIKIAAVQDAA